MSKVQSSSEHLTLNADGSGKDIKFQANGVEKASISSAGAFTSTTIDATALTGALPAIDGSNLTGVDPFPSGTKLSFFQASAPTGWTQDTGNNNKALRVVSGTGGGTGGTHGLTSPPSLAHTHSTPSHSHSHSLSAGSHTLSTSEMPSHNHALNIHNQTGGGTSPRASSGSNIGGSTGSTGGSGSHSHSLSGSITSGGSGTSGSTTPTAFAPQYIDVIVCSKD